jgi:NAD(P)-dependent dehydrogenase (short-subunit alcohol dehydrogenase family)
MGRRKGSMRLTGKVGVITGAGSGIGRATALLFAREGARVVAADIKLPAAEETVEVIRGTGGDARAMEVDVANAASVQRLFKGTLDTYGRLDVLVNNAGYGFAATVEETEEDDWDRLMAVNLSILHRNFRQEFRPGSMLVVDGGMTAR